MVFTETTRHPNQYLTRPVRELNQIDKMKIQFQSGKKSRKEKNRPPPKIEKLRNIPTLFDPEISRRPTVPTLPDLQDTKNVILMSINLATLGCALMNHNGRNTVVDSQCPKFGLSFPMLVTWLLRYFAHVSGKIPILSV